MKKLLLLFFLASFFSMAGFAAPGKAALLKPETAVLPVKKACTVTVTYTNAGNVFTMTVTASCTDCTQQQACDAAYQVISIVLP